MVKYLLLLSLCLTSVASKAQPDSLCILSCCCGEDPTPSGMMISHVHAKNEWMISYRYMGMEMEGLLQGSREINHNDVFSSYIMSPGKMQMHMHMLMAMYGISQRLTVMAMLNYRKASMDMEMFASSDDHHHDGASNDHRMESNGWGDTELHLLYAVIRKPLHQVLISAGASLPTGSIDEKGKATDMIYGESHLPYSMQNGTGIVQALASLTYVYQKERIAFSVQGSANLSSGKNIHAYNVGNRFTGNAWLAYSWLPWLSTSARGEYIAADKITGRHTALYIYNEPSAHPDNYGGSFINAYAGSVVQLRKGFLKNHRIGVEYGIPIAENVNGIQQSVRHMLNASWSYIF